MLIPPGLRYSPIAMVRLTWIYLKSAFRPKRFTSVTAPALLKRLESGKPLTIVDCRKGSTYENFGHIAGAISHPISEFDETCGDIPKENQVITVCYYGYLCQAAANTLADRGHKDVLILEGGMSEWNGHDYPTERSPKA